MKRIICVGNRYLAADAAGPRVFDYLVARELPTGVEVIDGGIAGLNLLGLVEGAERVVFVDAVTGFFPQGVVILPARAIPPPHAAFDHAAGVEYLFSLIPQVCDNPPAELYLVGLEGAADAALIARAGQASLRLASEGLGSTDNGNDRSSGGNDVHVH